MGSLRGVVSSKLIPISTIRMSWSEPVILATQSALPLEVDAALTDIYGTPIGEGFRRLLPDVPAVPE